MNETDFWLPHHGAQMFRDRARLCGDRRQRTKIVFIGGCQIVGSRASRERRDPRILIYRPCRERRGAEIMTEHRDARAVGDRLRIRARHGWIACVVERNEFDRPSVDAALGVHLVDCKLCRDQTFRPSRGGRARERTGERDANRLRAGPEDGGPGDSEHQDDARNNGKPHYKPLLHRRSLHRSI